MNRDTTTSLMVALKLGLAAFCIGALIVAAFAIADLHERVIALERAVYATPEPTDE